MARKSIEKLPGFNARAVPAKRPRARGIRGHAAGSGALGGSTEALAGLAQAHAVYGDRQAMGKVVQQLVANGDRYVSPYNVARAFGAAGDTRRALEWLEKAYQEHNPDLIELTREPSFRSLWSEEKFRQLTRRIGWPAC